MAKKEKSAGKKLLAKTAKASQAKTEDADLKKEEHTEQADEKKEEGTMKKDEKKDDGKFKKWMASFTASLKKDEKKEDGEVKKEEHAQAAHKGKKMLAKTATAATTTTEKHQ